ncbi:MAG: ABC transporter permease [Leucobacter sp.]|nr:ABC transporter permease [Leucobacter sp.]
MTQSVTLTPSPGQEAPARRRIRGGRDLLGLLIATIALFIVLTFAAPSFATTANLLNLMRDVSFVGIIAFGMTFVIIAAEIDISVGSAMAFASALLGSFFLDFGIPLPLTCLLVLAAGTLVGLFAGFIRAKTSVPSFIVTLALFTALRGAALMITDALLRSVVIPEFTFWGAGSLLGIPLPAILMLVTFAVFWFVSTRTAFGRSVYAVGGNEAAAQLSGISVVRVRVLIFAITGFLAAVSGLLLSARIGTSNASIGNGVEFAVISAVIVGGASLYGGRGSMVGTLLGVLFIGMLNNGMVLMGVNSYAQGVAQGAIVLGAVLISAYVNRDQSGRKTFLGFRTKSKKTAVA